MKTRVILLLLCTATNVWAQSNNQSDVTGPTITTSDIAANAFTAAGPSVVSNLTKMQATLARASFAPQVIPIQTQTTLAALLVCTTACSSTQEIANGLTGTGAGAPPMERSLALAEAMRGLSRAGATGNHQRVAQQLQRAANAFRDLITSAGEQYLADPPAELIAAHALLSAAMGRK